MSVAHRTIAGFGRYAIFLGQSLQRIAYPPVRFSLVMQQLEFVGVKSFAIIVMAAVMVGAVFGIQFGAIFQIFGAESLIGAAASFALSKELAPVIGSFLVTGRAGSAMAAEIATMKVNEQIDAMRVMGVNPISYLVSPRVIASMIMMPLLSAIFVLTGIVSAFVIGTVLFNIDAGIFLDKIRWITEPRHVFQGLEKAAIFGIVFSSVGCYQGFHAQGGAKGVGRSTTRAVVLALVTILVSDFFISYLQMSKLV